MFAFLLFTVLVVPHSHGQQQQKFRIKPQDLQVLEGAEALLRCEVQNLNGQVQWTKDGFALGTLLVLELYVVLTRNVFGFYRIVISSRILCMIIFYCNQFAVILNTN